MPRRKTHEEFVKEVYELVGDEYEVLEDYKNSYTKTLIRHNSCSTEYKVSPNNLLGGSKCPKCSGKMKKTTEQYKEEVYNLVRGEYAVIGEYINAKTKIEMMHNICGSKYMVQPSSFLNGRRCSKCSGNMKKTTKQFKEDVYNLVGDEYRIIGSYINARTKILIKHELCGTGYEVVPNDFLRGTRCSSCSGNMKKTTEQFKEEVYDLVGEEYVLLGEYINNKTKVLMGHELCGQEYMVKPYHFFRGVRCPKCSGNMKKTTEQFKGEVYNLVGEEYVLLGEYINNKTKVLMRHELCGHEYKVKPDSFLRGGRCPRCNSSKGELKIKSFLGLINIIYLKEYIITINSKKLRVDFVILGEDGEIKLGIEFDGKQHFESIKFFGGLEGFKERQKRDKLKDDWFKENNIPLLRIPYWNYDNIEDILKVKLLDLGLIEK